MTEISSPLNREDATGTVGDDIRSLRKSRRITLADCATRLERSIGWLSQVERGQTEPGIADLRRIASLFEIPISFFFRNEQSPADEHGIVVRKDKRASLGSHAEGLVEELLSPHLSGDFEMLRSSFQPGAKSDLVKARPTQEGGYLVSGQLTMWIGENRYELAAGDSFQFQNENYRWENAGKEPAVAIWVISPPVY